MQRTPEASERYSLRLHSPSESRLATRGGVWQACTVVALVASTGWLYGRTLSWIVHQWRVSEYYSHGFLIPLISMYLVWQKRRGLRSRSVDASSWGLGVVSVGLALHVISLRADVLFLSGCSLVILIAGLVLTYFGAEFLREVAFPICFLMFAIPMSGGLIDTVGFPLQLSSARCAMALSNVIASLRVEQVGTSLHMGGFEFTVDAPCSGLKAVIALTALSSLIVHLTRLRPGAKLFIFATALPVALFANSFRIFITLCVAKVFGREVAVGFFHGFAGILLYLIAALGLLGLVNWMTKMSWANARTFVGNTSVDDPPVTPLSIERKRQGNVLGALCLLVVSTSILGFRFSHSVCETPRHPIRIPLSLGEWRGKEQRLSPGVYDALKAHYITYRSYVNGRGEQVSMTVVVGGDSFHWPEECYKGAGQRILDRRLFPITIGNQTLEMNEFIAEGKGRIRRIVWFNQTNGRVVIPSLGQARVRWAWERLTRHPHIWAQVQVVTPVNHTESEARRTLTEFLRVAWAPLVKSLNGGN